MVAWAAVCWDFWRLGTGSRQEVRHLILRIVEILAVLESELEGRHLPILEAVSEISETDWTTFPICGFRATPWVRKFIQDQDIAPRSWYVR